MDLHGFDSSNGSEWEVMIVHGNADHRYLNCDQLVGVLAVRSIVKSKLRSTRRRSCSWKKCQSANQLSYQLIVSWYLIHNWLTTYCEYLRVTVLLKMSCQGSSMAAEPEQDDGSRPPKQIHHLDPQAWHLQKDWYSLANQCLINSLSINQFTHECMKCLFIDSLNNQAIK